MVELVLYGRVSIVMVELVLNGRVSIVWQS